MKEQILKFVIYYAPIIIFSIIELLSLPIIKKIIVKFIKKRAQEVEPNEQLKEVNKELKEIKKEIMEMRGKVK